MITGIIPIWVIYYAKDIIKLDNANVLEVHAEKYHVYDHEFGSYIRDQKERKRRSAGRITDRPERNPEWPTM